MQQEMYEPTSHHEIPLRGAETTPGASSSSTFPTRGIQSSSAGPAKTINSDLVKALAIIAEEIGLAVEDLTDSTLLSNLGIDSLSSIVISSRFRAELARKIDFGSLYEHSSTIGELKKLLVSTNSANTSNAVSSTSHSQSSRRQDDQNLRLLAGRAPTMSSNDAPGPINSFLNKLDGPLKREKHRQVILESLDFPQSSGRQFTITKELAEACHWFLETPQCRNWLDTSKLGNHIGSHNGMLWIKGKSSSGKSTLMKFLLSHTCESMKEAIIVPFFFNARGYLLLQLLQERRGLQRILDTTQIERPWSIGTLKLLLNATIRSFGKASLILFIDALDECEESQIREMLSFLTDLCDRVAPSETKLRICLASKRVYPLLGIARGLEFILETYGNAMVEYLNKNLVIGHNEVTESIHFEILKRASGNFKWATHVTNWINKQYAEGHDLRELYGWLCSLPSDRNISFKLINEYTPPQTSKTQVRFPVEFGQKVDMQRVNLQVLKKWVAGRISEILDFKHNAPIELCFKFFDSRFPDIKSLPSQLREHLASNAMPFCKELWGLCLSAQCSPHGVPKELLEAKKLELTRLANSSRKQPLLPLPPAEDGGQLSTSAEPSTLGVDKNAAQSSIPGTMPFLARIDHNRVRWIVFEYLRDRVRMEYTIRCDVESVDIDELAADFKTENCVYPGARYTWEKYRGVRQKYEIDCNVIGWALAQLNPCLQGKRGLIQCAVDNWLKILETTNPRIETRCNTCSERHVKCDGKQPECNNCVRTGRQCGGWYPPILPPTATREQAHTAPMPGTKLTATNIAHQDTNRRAEIESLPLIPSENYVSPPLTAPISILISDPNYRRVLVGCSTLFRDRWQCEYKHSTDGAGRRCSWTGPFGLLAAHFKNSHHPFESVEHPYRSVCESCSAESLGFYGAVPRQSNLKKQVLRPLALGPPKAGSPRPYSLPNSTTPDSSNTKQFHLSYSSSSIKSDSGYATVSCDSRIQADQSLYGTHIDDGDIQTVYTDLAGHSDFRIESYIGTFADDLFAKIGGKLLSAQMIEKLSDSLPTLLKALALNIGYQNRTQSQRDMMVFIHKQRQAITMSFKDQYGHGKDLDFDTNTTKEPKPTEIMDRWLASTDESKFDKFEDKPPEDDPGNTTYGECPEEPELMVLGLEEYRKILAEDPSYAWMLARLRRNLILSTVQYDIVNQIRSTIQLAFPETNHVSRKKSPEEVQVTFTAHWDIMGFLRQQGYGIADSKAIANSITLTGTRSHAQALTCQQYMAQMWPLTGSQMLKLIQETLKTAERKKTLFFNTPCRLTLDASIIDGSSVVVTASGLPHFIAEVGEQLAWLGSALRPSVPNTGICICTPSLVPSLTTSRNPPCSVNFVIEYKIERSRSSAKNPNGQCWSYLFSDPIIAGGFPILHREELDTGLEMPLELMVALTGTRYLDIFDSKIFIKGFNTMLVPAKHSEDLIVWHLLHLEKSRHVLGWCAEAISIVGTTRATYNIERSRLRKAHSHHMLEKVEVSGGQFVTGTAAFTLGNREKPVHITRFGFLAKLQWISSKYVVLWDERDKRGWLVNGASALLHILRASLEHSKRKFQSAWLLDPSALKDPDDPSRPDASLQVLINENNRNLTLYMDKTEVYEENVRDGATTTSTSRRQTRHYRLEDRIEHIYNILEKLIDHQTDVERRSGLQIKIRPRRQLEGWDFKDLVNDGDPIFPRATTLPTIGKGWVDFIRALHAVTLFGSGFGELIQPRHTGESICDRWSLLPKDRYYLATCVSNLLEIMEEDGDAASTPRRLCDNVVWHMKQATFDPCPCTKDEKGSHRDPVQGLFPSKFTGRLGKKPQVDLKGTGAVIFGHNTKLHWYWGDTGDPVKGDPPPETCDGSLDFFEDSGIGSSLGSSRFLSASDPSSAGSQTQSQGEKSPAQSRLASPPSPPSRPLQSSKRALQEIASSVKKKMRR
ncbi:hypothetical protein GQX73_g3778 [Xylaria multiplex]|uniref:Zn(2)-C6 fungal-type domain-containing protein n=1 Tax=Xylaria multiplex TaxID=323545 RepID=A0A7C8IV02_9PEZI|nr:hypothetical protein GQX73_g3778 [Xylaria multiplex]